MVEFLIDERKLSMMKLDYIWSHFSTTFNSKKLFNALPQGMASTINNFCHIKWLEVSEEQFKWIQADGRNLFQILFEKVPDSNLQAEIIQWNVHPPLNKFFFSVA